MLEEGLATQEYSTHLPSPSYSKNIFILKQSVRPEGEQEGLSRDEGINSQP